MNTWHPMNQTDGMPAGEIEALARRGIELSNALTDALQTVIDTESADYLRHQIDLANARAQDAEAQANQLRDELTARIVESMLRPGAGGTVELSNSRSPDSAGENYWFAGVGDGPQTFAPTPGLRETVSAEDHAAARAIPHDQWELDARVADEVRRREAAGQWPGGDNYLPPHLRGNDE